MTDPDAAAGWTRRCPAVQMRPRLLYGPEGLKPLAALDGPTWC